MAGKLEYIVGNLMIQPAQKTQNFFKNLRKFFQRT